LAAVLLAAVSVSVLVDDVLAGLNTAVTPAGKPVSAKATVPVKPVCGATVRMTLPAPPCVTFTLLTDAVSLKLGGAVTVSAIGVCAERAPEVAVTVRVEEPAAAVVPAVSFNVVPVKAAVTPPGRPVTASAAVPVKPLRGVTVKVLVPDPPGAKLKLAGEAASVKLGPAFTARLRVTVADCAPSVPVKVTVLVPGGADAVAVNVATLVVDVDAALNETVTPVGNPEAARLTLPVKLALVVTVIVLVAVADCTTLSVGVEVASVNVAGVVTVTAMVTVELKVPDVPVTVTVA